MIKLAVMGAGTIGIQHIKLIKQTDNCKLEAVVEIDPDNPYVKEIDVPIFKSLEELLNNVEIDGVIVSTPTSLHEDHAMLCIKHKVPALLEKPIANDIEAGKRIAKAVTDSNIPFHIGQVRRHSPVIQKTKEIINDGLLGDVLTATVIWSLYKPDNYFDKAWRRSTAGGPVFTNTIHDIDALRYIFGDIEEMHKILGEPKRDTGLEDTAIFAIKFKSGVLATVTVSDIASSPWSWELTSLEKTSFDHHKTGEDCYFIAGTKGSLSLPSLTLWTHKGNPSWLNPMVSKKLEVAEGNAMANQLVHFLEVIQGKVKPISSAQDALKSLAAVLNHKD